jgi:hypothetical protein
MPGFFAAKADSPMSKALLIRVLAASRKMMLRKMMLALRNFFPTFLALPT